jgi:hypothetical protein
MAEEINPILVEQIIEDALMNSAVRLFDNDIQQALRAIFQGRRDVCMHFTHVVADEVAEYISTIFMQTKAIYDYELDPSAIRVLEDDTLTASTFDMNLIVWTGRNKEKIAPVMQQLERELKANVDQLLSTIDSSPDAKFQFSITVVTDEDVKQRREVGIIVHGEILRSTQIWPRSEHPPAVQSLQQEYAPDELMDILTAYDPDLAPEHRTIHHAMSIEGIPPEQRGQLEYHLTDLKVALIRKIISDQLHYINIAKRWFTIEDLADLHHRRIGFGKIGGKAAGIVLASRILFESTDEEVKASLHIPESYFLGSDLIYIFMAMNGLMHWADQKYKPEDQLWNDYPLIQKEFQNGKLPPEVIYALKEILEEIRQKPLIVRSSSQLEDNFGTIFAGKYNSYFCPNQGTPEENLRELTLAIKKTYASTLKPDALTYRRRKGLQDYDERMAILIQVAQGEQFGRYYLPHAAGVAFSRNLYRWSPDIRREDGFARLVWGFGTRAVGRVGDDYPRLIALSHPNLQPDDSAEALRRYSQHYVDVIDLEENKFETLSIEDVLTPQYAPLRLLAELEKDGYFTSPRMRVSTDDIQNLAITFNQFLARTPFSSVLMKILKTIEHHYHYAVDVEFTVQIEDIQTAEPQIKLSLLQCRPQPYLQDVFSVSLPGDLKSEDMIFSTRFMVPNGYLNNLRYVVYIDPEAYFSLSTPISRNAVTMALSKINAALDEKTFVFVGPGRWGSTNPDLGVFVSYADIFNAAALVEVSGKGIGLAPEPSLGTHFFQDLMEAQIYPLAVYLDDEDAFFNQRFFSESENTISKFVDVDKDIEECIRVIEVEAYRPEHHVEIVMDDEKGRAVAFLSSN